MSDYSVLQAVDFGLGQFLARIYGEGFDTGPQNWRQLLKRPPQYKIFRGDFDEPHAAVRSIESAAIAKQVSQWLSSNRPSLPVILYGRKANVRTVEAEAGAYQHDVIATTDSGQQVRLSYAMMIVEYRLTLMAWDKPTLDAMQLAWVFHVSNAAKRGHKFDLAYEIDGEPLDEIVAEIIDPKTSEFDDVSVAANDGRLHAVSLPIRIKAYAIQGAKVSMPERMRWQLELVVGGESINIDGITPPPGFELDPNTGYCIDPTTGRYYDPTTGQLYQPGDGYVFNPETGHFDNPETGYSFNPGTGGYYDTDSGAPVTPQESGDSGYGSYEEHVKGANKIISGEYVPCQECQP